MVVRDEGSQYRLVTTNSDISLLKESGSWKLPLTFLYETIRATNTEHSLVIEMLLLFATAHVLR